jgi:TetR/AcrR family transcriptional regulator, tetracycline repressor protein
VITKTMPGRAKTELSREAIVERALAIADAEGLEAVTIRRVALEFGVTPMALYWHVQNKDELLAAMGQSFFDGIGQRYTRTGRWDDQICGVLETLIETLRKHPASAMLTLSQVLRCEEGQEIAEFTLDVLRTAGFDVVEAAEIARLALQIAIMLVTQQPGEELEVAAEERDAVMAEKRAAIRQLPVNQFPRLVEAADALTDCDDVVGYYASGVDMFIAGVRARQRRR